MKEKSNFLDDSSFRSAADGILEKLWVQVDELDMDEAEPTRTPGTFSIQFEDGNIFMLSLQTPIHEIWLSANYTAWHFLCESNLWKERDTGIPLTDVMSELLSEKLSTPVTFLL